MSEDDIIATRQELADQSYYQLSNDIDNDGLVNYLDADDDGDGTLTSADGEKRTDGNKNGLANYLDNKNQSLESLQLAYTSNLYANQNGAKNYELTNHLGNVMAVVSNQKTTIFGTDGILSYLPEVLQYNDYDPFGMLTPNRHGGEEYRYGFNTQEKTDEIAGEGNHTTAKYWEYDPRIGRRWNRDPKPIAEESEYAVNRNNPILNNDPEGDNPILGAVLAAFTEYAGKVGEKMLFKGQSFSEANMDLDEGDAIDIATAAGFGALSGTFDGGITRFASWLKSPTNQKIAMKLLEVGLSSLEGALKSYFKDGKVDVSEVLSGAITEVGFGSILKTGDFKAKGEIAAKNTKTSLKRSKELAGRNSPNERLVKKSFGEAKTHAKKAAKDYAKSAAGGAVAKTASGKASKEFKTPEPIKRN